MTKRVATRAGSLLLLALLAGCAAGAATGGGGRESDRTVITRAEIEQSTATNAFEVVRSLRPEWLRTRGRQSVRNDPGIRVYLDNASLGTLEALNQIDPHSVEAIEFLSAAEANFRFGVGNSQGAIVVRTRSSP